MAILAIDTSGDGCGTALADENGQILATLVTPMRRGHAEALLPQIHATLAEAGLTLAGLQAIAVARGPGSFTGLRVGLATAQGLALGLGIPAIGIDGFSALRAGLTVPAGHTLVLALDSRRDDPFVQIEAADGHLLLAAQPLLPTDVSHYLPVGPVLLAGTAPASLHTALAGHPVSERPGGPDISVLARFAAHLWRLGAPWPPATPLYLRAPDVTVAPTSPR